jgi:hypothetical protein
MTERWMIVGEDPWPTEDDLPIAVEPAHEGKARRAILWHTRIPTLMAGDRWCRVTLPPEPEDEGVEVNGVRYRIKDGLDRRVQYRSITGRWHSWEVYATDDAVSIAKYARIAIALGLVDAPPAALPADVQEVIDAAKDWAESMTPHYLTPTSRRLFDAVDALGDR